MKKLMFAAMAIMIGFVANAAAVQWTLGESFVPGSDEVWAENYMVYFFDNAAFSQSEAIASLAKDDLSFISKSTSNKLTDEEGYALGRTGDLYGNSQSITGYLVIFNAESSADATLAFVSDTVTGATTATGGNAALKWNSIDDTMDAKNWTAVNVPEPTSGLLLLLGMAGLALRRKQA